MSRRDQDERDRKLGAAVRAVAAGSTLMQAWADDSEMPDVVRRVFGEIARVQREEAAPRPVDTTPRCEVCDWPIAESIENRELVRENEVLRSNSDHLSSENALLARQVESMAMRIESLAEELAKPEDVRLREVVDALDGRAVIFDGLGARVGHLLDELDEWIERCGAAERRLKRAEGESIGEATARLVGEVAEAREALGAVWTSTGASLAEGIRAKTRFLVGLDEAEPQARVTRLGSAVAVAADAHVETHEHLAFELVEVEVEGAAHTYYARARTSARSSPRSAERSRSTTTTAESRWRMGSDARCKLCRRPSRSAMEIPWIEYTCYQPNGMECRSVARAREEGRAGRLVFVPADQWGEEDGNVIWWRLPVAEPPYVGTPLDDDWIDDHYTHFSRLPSNDEIERAEVAAGVTRG